MKNSIFENHSQCNKLIGEFDQEMQRVLTVLETLIARAGSKEREKTHRDAQSIVSELTAFIHESQLTPDPHEPYLEALQHTLSGLQNNILSQ